MVKNKKGFSLIELIIAIAILVILTGLLVPQFTKYIEKARWAKAVQTLDNIYTALEVAYVEIPQEDKEGSDETGWWIYIQEGKPMGETSNVGKAICESMRETLGDDLMDRVDINISVEEENENKDDLSVLLIEYMADEKLNHNSFYYFGRGMGNDQSGDDVSEEPGYPGTYGQYKNNKLVKWQ